MKRGNRASLSYALSIPLILSCLLGVSLWAKNKQGGAEEPSKHQPKIITSTILDDLQKRKQERLNLSPRELAAYANTLLEQKGFNYDFDACEILEVNGKSTGRDALPLKSPETLSYKMAQNDGRDVTFHIPADGGDGLCGECFFQIPVLQVTRGEILIVAEGKRYWLKRPKAFVLDEAELVDDTMQNVLRTWQLPYQTVPAGISPDGSKIYVEFHKGQGPDELILELSEEGELRFKARSDVELQGKGEWLEDHPQDPKNTYLSFMRFVVGGKSYIIKFTAPCT